MEEEKMQVDRVKDAEDRAKQRWTVQCGDL